MSCQQVPRIAEDPYTFTDTPVGSTYFTSPLQKHTAVKSANQLPSQLKISNRLNGSVNGVTSQNRQPHIPIYAKQSPVYQQSSVSQQRRQPENNVDASVNGSLKKSFAMTNAGVTKSALSSNASSNCADRKPITSNHHSNVTHSSNAIKNAQVSVSNEIVVSPKHNTTTFTSNGSSTNGSAQRSTPNNGFHVSQTLSTSLQSTNGKTSKAIALTTNESDGFVKPKVDVRHTTGKRVSISATAKAQTNGKRKRSYSQTSHHEALQRIPPQRASESSNSSSASQRSTGPTVGKVKSEWHAPDSLQFDYVGAIDQFADDFDATPCTQTFWFRDIPNENLLTREQRLETKRDNLRRQAFQYVQAQSFRNKQMAKMRLISVTKALKKFQMDRENQSTSRVNKCSVSSCTNNVLALTAYCSLHITLNADQKLFHPCTAKFSDNSQCRVPVFDISHELPLCPEHAWKRDNYNRMAQEQKPKKAMRKKAAKPQAVVRTPKRYKKKKKEFEDDNNFVSQTVSILPTPPSSQRSNSPKLFSSSLDTLTWNTGIKSKSIDPINVMSKTYANIPPSMNDYFSENANMFNYASVVPGLTQLHHQEIFTACENSSAYESSEDTGVGGLSESELISASDGIEIPLGDARLLEEHDITNVLEQLPEDAFNELFEVQQNDHYEPSQKEQDELARALEEVDEQVKSLEQMTGSTDFLNNFLNDEILVDSNDICADVLTTSSIKNEIRGLVQT